MSIDSLNDYKARIANPHQSVAITTAASSILPTGRAGSLWPFTLNPFNASAGPAPGAPAVPERTAAGALGQSNAGSGALRCLQAQLSLYDQAGAGSGVIGAMFILADRLAHQSGLSATSTSVQTTNLPTAALTRYTSGVGVMAALEIYTQIGATPTTVDVTYTNQAGTSGRESDSFLIGGSNARTQSSLLMIPLADGDTGIRSVENVTLAASTGTAGNFGVTLFRPLMAIPLLGEGQVNVVDPILTGANLAEEILDDACLFGIFFNSVTQSQYLNGTLSLSED